MPGKSVSAMGTSRARANDARIPWNPGNDNVEKAPQHQAQNHQAGSKQDIDRGVKSAQREHMVRGDNFLVANNFLLNWHAVDSNLH